MATTPYKQPAASSLQGQFQNLYRQGQMTNPYGMLTYQQAPVVSPRTNTGASFQDFPRAVTPMQGALRQHMGQAIDYKQGQQGQAFTHPFAGAGVGGNPWHDPAMHKQIQAYEQLVAKDRAGGLTSAERKQLTEARQKLQEQAKARAQAQGGPPPWEQQLAHAGARYKKNQLHRAPGDVFGDVLRDMMARMTQEQGGQG